MLHTAFKPLKYFILKTGMGTQYSRGVQLASVWLLTLDRVGEKRSKCARRRWGREDSEYANRQPGTSAKQRQSIFLILISRDLQLPIHRARLSLWLRFHCRAEVSRKPSANHHLPPHTFLWSSVILSSAARDCPSGPSLIYPSFLNI